MYRVVIYTRKPGCRRIDETVHPPHFDTLDEAKAFLDSLSGSDAIGGYIRTRGDDGWFEYREEDNQTDAEASTQENQP